MNSAIPIDGNAKNKTAAAFAAAVEFKSEQIELDDIDLSRQIRSDFEADFLLANRRLHPGLHRGSSLECETDQRAASPADPELNIGATPDNDKSQVRDP